ncbi:sigma-70 family RNA polymerase sigma factor [Tautonia plasticadhaerens]|uniref:ECF RNA polymerase sigma factor SigE n=1 Tax=Tautonia plasticadhaerens TaxID=2527974 RepID=A0A518GUX4_9BACT|nr:sigma-70 family RNA polymerase sigma factor [Tautonia plasticadhaerens]QDV32385.1 ECF RNA polymerase sigma factor SigE [Tautonia plasticadhaerens]
MGIERHGKVAREFRTLMQLGAVGVRTDGQLLERYVAGGPAAEGCFAELVERHGPMVLRVCRSILGDGPDALDAFQATFLVLVRRARSLCVRDSLGPWLYQVAWRVARCARKDEARRRRLERQAAGRKATSEDAPMPDPDSDAILFEELARLPDRYRVPLVLCDLEGQPQELAARHLGCAVGTIKSRLSRGRETLRARLARRGLAPTAALGAGVPVIKSSAGSGLPAALAESTITLVANQAMGGLAPVAVSALAEGVLTMMLFSKIRLLAIPGLATAVLASGIAVFAQAGDDGPDDGETAQIEPRPDPVPVEPEADPQVPTFEAERGPLTVTVKERGNLESTNDLEARSEIEGQTTIIMILPEGTKVVKDQLVCELDSAPLTDNLANQQITTERAQADYSNAIKTREVAEINVEEYLKGLFPRRLGAIDGRIELARAELGLERARLESLEAGEATGLELHAARVEVQRAELALDDAEGEKQVLVNYTREKQVKSLEGDVEKAKADELARKSAFELDKEREERLRRMIEKCKIYAPGNGIVVYHQEGGRWGSQEGPSIREGATVRERQTIFKLPDIDTLRVNTKVHESMIDQVRPGQVARIRVDAFPNETLVGRVIEVKPLPDPVSTFSTDVKVYTTLVEIEDGHEGLRPGMTAEVTILIKRQDDVISIPTQSVIIYGGNHHVWVQGPDGSWENRAVEVGANNSTYVEVTEGLVEGDRVALDPRAVMTEAEMREAFGAEDDGKASDDEGNWSEEEVARAEAASRTPAPRPPGGADTAPSPSLFRKFQNISAEDRQMLREASDEEKKEIMKKAGFTDAEIRQMDQMRRRMSGGGGPGSGGP